MNTQKPPRIAITLGDVNGIGPEILVKALAQHQFAEVQLVVVGDASVLREARKFAPECPPLRQIARWEEKVGFQREIAVFDAGIPAPPVRPGTLDPKAGHSAIEWFKAAVVAAREGLVDAIVTCPINKEAVQKAGHRCAGHTDLIADMVGVHDYRMCLFTETMRVVHITGHLSLLDALREVKRERIVKSIHLGHEALLRLGLAKPRIGVAGLNPHAGEAGAFGDEEAREIGPAIEECRASGINCTGPHSPDAVFRHMHLGAFDMVIAMYHDQGHIPMKLIAMDEGVNVTLGLPIVRTSVDHGTAFDIAGKGIAREDSLVAAVRLAAKFASLPET